MRRSGHLVYKPEINRRDFLARAATAAFGTAVVPARSGWAEQPVDHRLEIGLCTVDVAPRKVIRTVGYNGSVPGPLLRLREGRASRIQITNHTAAPEIVHWHGLHLPTPLDGAMEEGSPMIAPGATVDYVITPKPAGFRWYHTHTVARNDLKRAQYSGEHGFLFVDSASDSGAYDQEVFLALHDWEGHLTGSDDGAMNPVYDLSTINGRVLGHGEPIRVREGQRLLLHVLNSSPTEVHWIAFSGHTVTVIALDGNPIREPKSVPMLRLAPAERVCLLVEMNQPGTWILGEVRKHIQAAGMGIVVEYAGSSGKPFWQQPESLVWNYQQFGSTPAAGEDTAAVEEIPLVFSSKFKGHGAMERWTINGKSYPDTDTPVLIEGRRYRLRFTNKSVDEHPMHLHRHTFELKELPNDKPGGKPTLTRGIFKDTVLVPANAEAVVEFTANNPGNTLLHCHQQNHMDLGFMMVFRYA